MPYTTVITFTAYSTLAAADLNSNFSNLDYLNSKINSQFIILGASLKPNTNYPAAPGELQTATNQNNYVFMDFPDAGVPNIADIDFPMPSDYAGGTVTAKFYWTANSTSTNSVYWGIQAAAIADNEGLDVVPGSRVAVVDANKSTAYKLNISDVSSAITIAGTPAAGELINWQIMRDSSNGSDTLAATARLIAVVITYTRA